MGTDGNLEMFNVTFANVSSSDNAQFPMQFREESQLAMKTKAHTVTILLLFFLLLLRVYRVSPPRHTKL